MEHATADSLPDLLLAVLFGLAGPASRCAVPGVQRERRATACSERALHRRRRCRRPALALVCRRWHGLVWSEPWTALSIGGGLLQTLEAPAARARWLQHKRSLLERHAQHLTSLTVLGCLQIQACSQAAAAGTAAPMDAASAPPAAAASSSGLDSLLQPLRAAGRLAHLHLESSPLLEPPLLRSLRPLPALCSLSLDTAQLPPSTAAALAALTLTALQVSVGKVPPALLEVVAVLPLLRSLVLEAPRLAPQVGPP